MSVRRIVIIEDDGASRRALKGIFSRLGWQVQEAATVEEARAWLDADPEPDCIILDLMLPDGRGESILRHVRSLGWKTRVVVATAVISIIRLQKLEQLKPDDVLLKPLTAEAIWEAIGRLESLTDQAEAPSDDG